MKVGSGQQIPHFRRNVRSAELLGGPPRTLQLCAPHQDTPFGLRRTRSSSEHNVAFPQNLSSSCSCWESWLLLQPSTAFWREGGEVNANFTFLTNHSSSQTPPTGKQLCRDKSRTWVALGAEAVPAQTHPSFDSVSHNWYTWSDLLPFKADISIPYVPVTHHPAGFSLVPRRADPRVSAEGGHGPGLTSINGTSSSVSCPRPKFGFHSAISSMLAPGNVGSNR